MAAMQYRVIFDDWGTDVAIDPRDVEQMSGEMESSRLAQLAQVLAPQFRDGIVGILKSELSFSRYTTGGYQAHSSVELLVEGEEVHAVYDAMVWRAPAAFLNTIRDALYNKASWDGAWAVSHIAEYQTPGTAPEAQDESAAPEMQ